MNVTVYVEGASDKLAMEALLAPLLEQKLQEGVAIEFFETPDGDRKISLLTKVPKKAVNILRNDPYSIVVAMPDLSPKNKGFPHETFAELQSGILKNFHAALQSKGITNDSRFKKRFQVFCFQHDLEALILAAPEALASRLGVKALEINWKIPVEEQNHHKYPKMIVDDLFRSFGQRYKDTVDAPAILGTVDYQQITDRCCQCFKPFVEFLAGIKSDTF